jgi:hypothetical protein
LVVERFSQNVLSSGIFRLYIATGFFATLIFFVLNSDMFTPIEMLMGVIIVTVGLKGITNMMFALIILLFNLENKEAEMDFKYNSEKIDAMISELAVQEAKLNNEKSS